MRDLISCKTWEVSADDEVHLMSKIADELHRLGRGKIRHLPTLISVNVAYGNAEEGTAFIRAYVTTEL